MDHETISSKMSGYMYRSSDVIRDWLKPKLPRITDEWWNELVYYNLSVKQKEKVDLTHTTSLEGLDLAGLLTVFKKNLNLFKSNNYYFPPKTKELIDGMFNVRNDWSHPEQSVFVKEKITKAVYTMIDFMEIVFETPESNLRDMEQFALAVENDEEISAPVVPSPQKPLIAPVVKPEPTKMDVFEVGCQVELVSDPTKVGVVTGRDGEQYSVFMGNSLQKFFKVQLKLHIPELVESRIPLSRVRAALTAHQIMNPSSNNLYSLNSARVDFVPYQFRPALKMIKSDSPRILIADDVGVGKTIEAGLILKEMEARTNVQSVLIICPRPLVAERKWQLEMKRFDEDFTQLDGKGLQRVIEETDRDGEWPDRDKKTIIPYSLFGEDMLNGTEARTSKKNKKKGLLQLDPAPHFDLVIVDEAHAIRNENTYSHKAVEFLTQNADAVVFLTATPLQNKNEDLYSLLNVLRPDIVLDKPTFFTMSEPNKYVNSLLRIVRGQQDGWQEKAKEEISNILSTTWGRTVTQHNPNFEKVFDLLDKSSITREEKVEAIGWIESLHSFNTMLTRTRRRDIGDFCVRHTETVNVPFASEQKDLYEALIQFEEKALTILHGSTSVYFMMCTILRQAASCIYGLAPFMDDLVNKRLTQIDSDGEFFDDMDYDFTKDEENTIYELAEMIRKMSRELKDYDPKLEKLYEVIDKKQEEENNRIIIFSSFRHTLSYIKRHLIAKGYRVAQVDGNVPDEERYNIRNHFMMDRDEPGAIDVLLFSEVGCEGLDYQFCDCMVNYDLPWNPMRIEQRIGRIDRRGQKSETVRIHNMITEDTIDAVIYEKCLAKIGVFEDCIGDCSEILGSINSQISSIMFAPDLTAEDRVRKIEQLADNEVSRIQEINRLEKEEKSLYGFDLSNYIHDKDVQDAENEWISPEAIGNMVNLFLTDYLGEGEYIRANKDNEIRTLRLKQEFRQKLYDNLQDLKITNSNGASKLWNAYLRSENQYCHITFDPDCAKDNRDVAFLTQMHPLVMQAAQYEGENLPCEVGIHVSDDYMAPGDYDFVIYSWKYVGFKPDIRLVAVSENKDVEDSVLTLIQQATNYDFDSSEHNAKWDAIDKLHYEKWQVAKEEYVKSVKEDCEYRIDQLRQTSSKREIILKAQIENSTDEKIIRMKSSMLLKIQLDFDRQKEKMESSVQKADIHIQPLIKGVLHVE